MITIGEIRILNKFGELADRCGLSTTYANVGLEFVPKEKSGSIDYYVVHILEPEKDPDLEDKMSLFRSLIGMDGVRGPLTGAMARDLRELDRDLDDALSLAPRARARGR